MGRYRPPAPPSSPYITPEGYRRLQDELDELWRRRRPEVTKALAAAAAEGDRSENAEYTYRKKQLGEIDRRVRYLGKRLKVLKVVREPPTDPHKVFFGAHIELEDDDRQTRRFRIVGPDEIDPKLGAISIDSPLARAVLGKGVGEVFDVRLPEGTASYEVRAVHY